MAKTIVQGGRYFDKETSEYIIIESITDVITYVFESDGQVDTWCTQNLDEFAECLVAANDIAVAAERSLDVKVKKLNDSAIIPEYKTIGAAGFDIHSIQDAVIQPLSAATISTGLAFELPQNYELEIRGRSGNGFNLDVWVFNGTLDSDYRGEAKIRIMNFGNKPFVVNKGDRIAQGVIKKIEQVNFIEHDKLSNTERGEKGFGSTGL